MAAKGEGTPLTTDLVGVLASTIAVVMLAPQWVKQARDHDTSSFSVVYISGILISSIFWAAYAVLVNAQYSLVSAIIHAIFATHVLVIMWTNHKRRALGGTARVNGAHLRSTR